MIGRGWNHLMPELTPEQDSTGGEKKKLPLNILFVIYR
jgi:hypothetical protein